VQYTIVRTLQNLLIQKFRLQKSWVLNDMKFLYLGTNIIQNLLLCRNVFFHILLSCHCYCSCRWGETILWTAATPPAGLLFILMSMESHTGVISTGENRRTRRKTCPSATLSSIDPTWANPLWTLAFAMRGRRLTMAFRFSSLRTRCAVFLRQLLRHVCWTGCLITMRQALFFSSEMRTELHGTWKVWKWESSGIQRRVVSLEYTDVSEVRPATDYRPYDAGSTHL
jgi:hypothetical protein